MGKCKNIGKKRKKIEKKSKHNREIPETKKNRKQKFKQKIIFEI